MSDKRCTLCGNLKPLAEYHRRKRRGRYYYRSRCKVCTNATNNRTDNRDQRERNLRFRYGLTAEQYSALLAAQAGGCAICGKAEKLVVDHCHDTGRVRGLLCHSCNVLIGYAGDSADVLRRAAAYLS